MTGEIPTWAAGSLYRTGPGVTEIDTEKGKFEISHWFDGLAHSHRFEIVAPEGRAKADKPDANTNGAEEAGSTNGNQEKPSNGVRVFYSSRYQSDHIAESIRQNGSLRTITFAQRADPCVGLLGKAMSVFRRDKGLSNVAVTVQADVNVGGILTSGANGKGAEATEKDGVNGKDEQGFEETPAATNGAPLQELGHRGQASSLYLATDAAVMSRVDPSTLEPLGFVSQSELHPDLKGPSSGAHGKRDPATGDFFNFNLELGLSPAYRVFQIVAATGEVKILATLRGWRVSAGYIHSFFLTENYVVLCVSSLRHVSGGAMIPLKANILEALSFEDVPCDWYVIDRRGDKGLVGEFKTPKGFFFHSTNSFEEDGDLVCEAIWYKSADILYSFYYDVLTNREGKAKEFWKDKEFDQRLTRYRFPLGAKYGEKKANGDMGIVKPVFEIQGPSVGELPTYNTRFATRRHRFVYGVSNRGLSTMFDAIVKTDTEERTAVLWRCPPKHTPGEPIFVAKPGEKVEEDEGVLLSVVLDGEKGTSYLLCLDAQTMDVMGRAECEFAVGLGFHGRMVAAK